MGLTLQIPPGFSDLADAQLAHDKPILGLDVAKIYDNAAFGLARVEVFQDLYHNGDTVPTPISPIDGYVYSRSELIYIWVPNYTGNTDGWISGKDALWYCAWLVDQTNGKVYSDEYYLAWARSSTHTNDGELLVYTIAQRAKTSLIMAATPSWTTISAGWMGTDDPLTEQLIQALNDDGKFAVTKNEVFYLGEFYNGQTAPVATSPVDGYVYTRSEMKYFYSWRWTTIGNVSPAQQPSNQYQLGPFSASINASTGVVSTSVYYSGNGGETTTSDQHHGRLAVFAFCQRSATPASLAASSSFAEIDSDFFMPGSTLRAATVEQMEKNVRQAVLTPEFFGPTAYQNGNTVSLPVSPIDGYTYARSELYYIWTISQESSGSYPPGAFDHDRCVLWNCSVNQTTGAVSCDIWRLAPGGPYVDAGAGQMRLLVITVARRAAQAATLTNNTGTNSQSDYSTATTDPSAYNEVEAAGTPVAVEQILNFLSPFTVVDNSGNKSTDVGILLQGAMGVVIDGGGSAIATLGSKGYLQMPFAATITGWTILTDAACTCQLTVKKSDYATFPTTSSIVAAAPPAISSSGQKATSTTLTGWTTALAKDDIIEFNLDSIGSGTPTRIMLKLQLTRVQ